MNIQIQQVSKNSCVGNHILHFRVFITCKSFHNTKPDLSTNTAIVNKHFQNHKILAPAANLADTPGGGTMVKLGRDVWILDLVFWMFGFWILDSQPVGPSHSKSKLQKLPQTTIPKLPTNRCWSSSGTSI